jgi:glycosyltransferase involved in cell wall biosynthesis
MKPLRIGILTPTFLPKCSGAEVFHHNLAVRLADAGHHPVVIAPSSRVRRLRASGWTLPYDVTPYPGRLWNILKHHAGLGFLLNRLALDRLQAAHGFDVWHAVVLHPTGISLADWQSRSGAPGLIRAVGDDVGGLPGEGHEPWKERLLRRKLPLARAVVALSSDMADELAGLGVPAAKIRVIPNAVDADRFPPNAAIRSAARSSLGMTEHDFVFLCVARNHPQKDLPTLLRAFRILQPSFPEGNIRLVIAGRDVPALAGEASDLADRIHLLEIGPDPADNNIPTMPPQRLVDLYRMADAFVLSSLLEGFSSALVEAMAAGLPLVLTDVPGIRGVVTDGREGLLVPAGSPDAMAGAMLRLTRDPSLRTSMSAAARESSRRYGWPAVVQAYESLYGELAGGRGAA